MLFEDGLIKLSGDERENLLENDGKYYRVDFLKANGKYVKGGNGLVFKLIDEEEDLEYVVKFLKFPNQWLDDWKMAKRSDRFDREIEALYVAKNNSLSNVVEIKFAGTHKIGEYDFGYYVMEKCDCTLNEFLSKNELDISQKVLLCYKILIGIQGLHEYQIYHRDIKHDNIYFIGNEPYVGDLGLAYYRDSDIRINERGELIGPTGWFSPEAINKFLVEKTPNIHGLDCVIDEKSEIFQLGKLFWYIFQGNIPIGQIEIEDFKANENRVFAIILDMLQYSKIRRSDASKVNKELNSYLSYN